jgi:gamma-glutamyltranspeptidase/glutathione hydrolase
VLNDGGNAFDAAVTASSVLSVVEPYMSGLGGVGAAVCYHAPSGEYAVLDFHGRAAAAAAPERWSRWEEMIDGF